MDNDEFLNIYVNKLKGHVSNLDQALVLEQARVEALNIENGKINTMVAELTNQIQEMSCENMSLKAEIEDYKMSINRSTVPIKKANKK